MRSTPTRRRAALAATAIAALGIAAACSSGPDGFDTGDAFSITAGLEQIPFSALDDWQYIAIGDIAVAADRSGMTPSLDDGRWFSALTGGPPIEDQQFPPALLLPPVDATMITEARVQPIIDDVGWHLFEADTFAGVSAPQQFLVVTGDFDDDTLVETLVDVGDGIVSLGEDGDWEPTALNPAGLPMRMAQADNRIALSSSSRYVGDWLNDRATTAESHAVLAGIAAALDEHEVTSAVMVPARQADFLSPTLRGGTTPAPETVAERLQELENQLIRRPFDMIGIGWGGDLDDPQVTIVYSFPDTGDALDALSWIEDLYTDGLSPTTNVPYNQIVALSSVEQDEHLVVVTGRPEGPRSRLSQLLFASDLLFATR